MMVLEENVHNRKTEMENLYMPLAGKLGRKMPRWPRSRSPHQATFVTSPKLVHFLLNYHVETVPI